MTLFMWLRLAKGHTISEREITPQNQGSPHKNPALTRRGGAYLLSQYLGDTGRWISDFKAYLVYGASSRTARATKTNKQTNPVWGWDIVG